MIRRTAFLILVAGLLAAIWSHDAIAPALAEAGFKPAVRAADETAVEAAQPVLANSAAPIKVRAWPHPGFTRVVIDWTEKVGYRIERVPDGARERINLIFDKPANFAPGKLAQRPAREVRWLGASNSDEGAIIGIEVPSGAALSDMRLDDHKIVVDVAAADLGTKPLETAAGPADAAGDARPATAEAAAKDAPAHARDAAPTAAPRGIIGILPKVTVLESGAQVTFPWPEATQLAAYEQGGYAWLVFDRPAIVNLDELKRERATAALAAKQIPADQMTVLRFSLPDGASFSTAQAATHWSVVVSADAAAAEGTAIVTETQPADVGGGRVVFGQKTGALLEVSDPATGDTLLVTALDTPNRGVAIARSFVQFDVLASRQGIVIRPKSQGISLKHSNEGIEVAASDGLILSVQRAAKGAGPQVLRVSEWRRGGIGEFHKGNAKLLEMLARSPEGGRAAARLDLAQFYYANNLEAESLAVLKQIASQNPEAERNRLFRALRGVVNFEMGRYKEASQDLNDPLLDGIAEVSLWRGMLAAALEEWEKANDLFADGRDAVDHYPADMHARFRMAITRARAASGDLISAESELAILEKAPMNETESERVTLLRAEIADGLGDFPASRTALESLGAAKHRWVRSRAEFLSVNADLRDKKIDAKAAIARLDRLRFVWRGDDLEFGILRRLAELHLEARDYRAGLGTLREVVSRYPNHAETPALREHFVQVFDTLFASGAINELSPVAAVGVYYSFREIIPNAQLNDAVVDSLVERLIEADLLAKAAELLQAQTDRRPAGLDKGLSGARLAAVYLLDRQPEAALAALAASAEGIKDAVLLAERARLSAAANMALGKFQDALAVIAEQSDPAAVALRADIFWNAKNWPEAAANLYKLLGARSLNPGALTEVERRRILQLAVALTLADRPDLLADLRVLYAKHLDGTAEADAFAVLSDPAQRRGTRFSELIRAAAQIKEFETFMAGYRQKLASRTPGQAVN